MKLWMKYKKTPFVIKMTIGFVLGILIGVIFREQAEILSPLGTLLINLLSLVAIPVIFLTVVLAVNKMNVTQLTWENGWEVNPLLYRHYSCCRFDWTCTCFMDKSRRKSNLAKY